MLKAILQALSKRNLLVPAVERTEHALGSARHICDSALGALFDGIEPERDVYSADHELNKAEIDVRRMCVEHLVARPQGDLATAVVLLAVIVDIERIGDYAKNLYELRPRLQGDWPEKPPFDELRSMRDDLHEMFDDAMAGLTSADRVRATAVMDHHAEFTRRCEHIVDALLKPSGLTEREAIVGALAARYMKRIGAHLSNLASSVVNPYDRIGYRYDAATDTTFEL